MELVKIKFPTNTELYSMFKDHQKLIDSKIIELQLNQKEIINEL